MGSSPESVRFLLQQLQCRPHSVCWSAPHPVLLLRGHNHKLGFHFKTLPLPDSSETVTVVVKVKEDCRIGSGSLQVGDRIVSVGNVPVTCYLEAEVTHLFSHSQEPSIHLLVSAMSSSQVKRFPSMNSGASGGSQTASVDSGERPKPKRFQKSSSTETPPPTSPISPSADLGHRSAGPGPKVVVGTPPPRRQQPCPARECATYNRPPYPQQRSAHLLLNHPHHHHHLHQQQFHSLPDRMEDDIILTDDILLCEADGPNSLPPVLTPLPNTSTPSHPQPPGTAFVNTVSTGIGGESVGGSAPQQRSLGVDVCRAPGCNMQRLCLWHKFVLTHPQYVIWEPLTKKVVLEKQDQSSFGFKYKVKKYDGPPAEVFALVTEVMAGGVAWNLLLSGDWIRSINGTPVNTAKEAFSPDFRNLTSLRLMIQRPEGLSWKGVPKLKGLAHSSGISLHIPVSIPLEAASPPPPPPPADNAHLPAADQKSKYVDRHPGVEEGCRIGSGEQNFQQAAFFDDPLLEQYPRQAQSPGEHIPLNTLSRPSLLRGPSVSERCVFPQARVVVCGAHGSAADFVRGLVGDGVDVDPDIPAQSFQLSLQRGADSGVTAHAQHRRLTTLVKEREPHACRAGLGAAEGGEGSRCVNVELHAINSEQFFHHCCPWLLPSCTLVVFTFHVHKLLNQPQVETRRLAAMVRSVRDGNDGNGASPSSKIQLYGVPSGAQRDVSAEEIQGMFYVTDSGSRLLERQGLAVNVTVPTCGRSMAAARQAMFSACQKRLPRITAAQCVARVADSLSTVCGGVKVTGREVTSVVKGVVGEGDPAVVQSVICGLLDTGSLLLCGSSRPGKDAEQEDYLLPFSAFLHLSSLLIKPLLDACTIDCRQKWFKLFTTARLTRPELAELLASEGSPLSVEVLEQLGVAFKLHAANGGRGDSGFAEDAAVDYVLPYFLQDCGDGQCEEEGYVLRFERCVSWRGYFNMLCKLSALPATEEVVISGQCRSTVRHNGLRLSLRWRKDSSCDSIFVAVGRSSRSRESVGVQELERLFSFVIPPAVPFKVQMSDSTSPTSNLPSRDHEADLLPSARSAAMHEETFVKPVVEVESPCSAMDEPYRDLRLTALPWSVLNQVANRLSVPMPAGHDWRSVAELAGKSMSEILAYEAISTGGREVPAMPFLREWILTGRVQQFLDILQTLERPDVRDVILDHLRERENGAD